MKANIPVLPSPANVIVADFAQHLLAIQPDFIEGIYLTGSIPLNDFHSNKSDIDFLVFCKELPDETMSVQLKHIHHIIEKQYKKPNLSGHYLTSASIQTDNPENIQALTYHNGSIRFGKFEMAAVSLFELKNNSMTVYGKPSNALLTAINNYRLNNFIHHNINTYWTNWIEQHSSYTGKRMILLLFPWFTEWAVLGVARQLYTLQTGKITSKIEAGYFCLTCLPDKFHSIINEAINIRKDNRTYPIIGCYAIKPSFKRVNETIACVNYIIALFNNAYTVKYKTSIS